MSHISTLTCTVPSAHCEPVLCWSCVFTSHLVSFLLLSSLHFWSSFVMSLLVSYLFKFFSIIFSFSSCFFSCFVWSLLFSSHLVSSPLFSSFLISSFLFSSPLISSPLLLSSLIQSHLLLSHFLPFPLCLISSPLISSPLILSPLIFLSCLVSSHSPFSCFFLLTSLISFMFVFFFLPSHLVSSGLFSLMPHFCFLGGFLSSVMFFWSCLLIPCFVLIIFSYLISSHLIGSLLSYVSFLLVLTHQLPSIRQGPYAVFTAAYSLNRGYPLKWTSLTIIVHLELPTSSSKKGNDGVAQIMI